MKDEGSLRILLSESMGSLDRQRELFALLNLGIIQSLPSGALSVNDALERFYHADNCLFVRRQFRNRTADAIMGRGVQLPDLFGVLPAGDAQREFSRELEIMRTLCLKLLTPVAMA